MNIEIIRDFCLSLPKVTEDVKWGTDLCFCIEKKIFCILGTSQDFSVCFKCKEENFDMLCEREGIVPAPYLARNKWVLVKKSSVLNRKDFEKFIKDSYMQIVSILSKKQRNELGF
jgi:predicted DNA-binding protein (MmcQ/YjbR family)